MANSSFQGKFIDQAEVLISENISNEQFGVSELADLMNMSRSNLLRKIKKDTGLSASQFIREIRLKKGMALLNETDLTVSEISYQVGFGNTSYFIKCFREYYGYSPGDARKGSTNKENIEEVTANESFLKRHRWSIMAVASLLIIMTAILLFTKSSTDSVEHEAAVKKSIAVLPFKNMSSDSTNLYFVNGLMESTLTNLQKIGDLRVISRTSVEKYRHTNMTIAEIAKELNVGYLVEGSGQRVGDEVLLNIQLIDASGDTPIWAEQYKHQVVDIFGLQNEVSKKIVDAIEATVTPSELQQIDKKPTDNLVAYDYYLQALEPFQKETKRGLEEAIPLFEKAVAEDPKFALAYSKLAISYYYLDVYQTQKQYTEVINNYADKALLYDPKSAESLIAKALYYMNTNEYRLAVPHLEKALEYNPNSSAVVQMLGDLYSRAIPDTGNYLKYALKGIQLDIEANDSIGKSYIYLLLSNALAQTGFPKESKKYINLSLDYNPKNPYASYLKVFIDYAEHLDLKKATHELVKVWQKDTTRLDLMQDVAKLYYFQENYDSAYYYYNKFVKVKEDNGLNIYPQEDIKIGVVYDKMGFHEKAQSFYKSYSSYCENDESIYQPASLAMKYSLEKKYNLAIEQLNLFATKSNFQYWMILFMEKDPLMKALKNHPNYKETIQKVKDRFWEDHERLEKSLKENDLI
ncbi:MAG: helix-turn-helix domain-containing protein [Flavobacteriaceae bacterium]|nr:helix-turn-helix domain-containing protein [Mangrovimonas sp.]